jgi:hypothetical protein
MPVSNRIIGKFSELAVFATKADVATQPFRGSLRRARLGILIGFFFYINCIYLQMNKCDVEKVRARAVGFRFARGASRSEAVELVLRRGSRHSKQTLGRLPSRGREALPLIPFTHDTSRIINDLRTDC